MRFSVAAIILVAIGAMVWAASPIHAETTAEQPERRFVNQLTGDCPNHPSPPCLRVRQEPNVGSNPKVRMEFRYGTDNHVNTTGWSIAVTSTEGIPSQNDSAWEDGFAANSVEASLVRGYTSFMERSSSRWSSGDTLFFVVRSHTGPSGNRSYRAPSNQAYVTINDASPSFSSGTDIQNQTYVQNHNIPLGSNSSTLQLPSASGGNGTLTYTLTPALPAGLSFSASNRRITGTPTTYAGYTFYTYKATDSDTAGADSASLTFYLGVEEDLTPDLRGATVHDRTFVRDTGIGTLQLPAATSGNSDLTYTVTPALPSGLSFDPGNRRITGTPTVDFAATEYTYTATDFDGDTASLTFIIRVIPDALGLPSLDPGAYTYARGQNTTLTLTTSTGGVGATGHIYTLDPAPPAGMTFNATANPPTITGTPTAVTPAQTYTYTVKDNAADTKSITFTITITQTTISDRVANQIMPPEETITPLALPAAIGGTAPYTYTLEGDLPDGLSFDGGTRTITGTPSKFSGARLFTYKATDANGIEDSVTFTIRNFAPDRSGLSLEPEFSAKEFLDEGTDSLTFSVGEPIEVTLPEQANEMADDSMTYSLFARYGDRDLPDGVVFDPASRELSGTPTEEQDSRQYVYMAKNDIGEDSFIITMVVAAQAQPASTPIPQLAATATPVPAPMATPAPAATLLPAPVLAAKVTPAPVATAIPAPAATQEPAAPRATAIPAAPAAVSPAPEPAMPEPMPTAGPDRSQVVVVVPTPDAAAEPSGAAAMADTPAATPAPMAAAPTMPEAPATQDTASQPQASDGGGSNLLLIVSLIVLALVAVAAVVYLMQRRRR